MTQEALERILKGTRHLEEGTPLKSRDGMRICFGNNQFNNRLEFIDEYIDYAQIGFSPAEKVLLKPYILIEALYMSRFLTKLEGETSVLQFDHKKYDVWMDSTSYY